MRCGARYFRLLRVHHNRLVASNKCVSRCRSNRCCHSPLRGEHQGPENRYHFIIVKQRQRCAVARETRTENRVSFWELIIRMESRAHATCARRSLCRLYRASQMELVIRTGLPRLHIRQRLTYVELALARVDGPSETVIDYH